MTTSNHNDDDQEMSMDEILASIRRYVSSDEPIQKAESKPTEQVATLSSPSDINEEPHTQRITPHLNMPNEEVVRLNERVPEEAQQTSAWMGESFKPFDDTTKSEQRSVRAAVTLPKQSNVSTKAADGLVSDKTLATTMESFARLRDASVQKPAPRVDSGASSGLNQTLDQLFESLARPMIRDWMDRNLPPMVERMVAKEIERITKLG